MIWLVGNRGMLGTAVEELLKESETAYIASDREVDITGAEVVEAFLGEQVAGGGSYSAISPGRPGEQELEGSEPGERCLKLTCIINCAAYTAVDRAEEDARSAGRLNSTGPKNLARAARRRGAKLIHVSTDYVFDGTKEEGYYEDNPQSAVSVYGRTKWAGEEAIRRSGVSHCIVRTSWLFGEHGPNFVATMLSRFFEGKPVRVVNDQWGSPTYAGDLAEALVRLAGAQLPDVGESGPRLPQGFYHFTNGGRINWYDFAREIFSQAREIGLCPDGSTITPVPSSEYPTKARRPVYSFLHTDRIREALDIEIRPYQEALHNYLATIKNQRNKI